MRRLGVVLLLAFVILAVGAAGASAAPEGVATGEVGPYEGVFYGTVRGDEGSTAPIALGLTHRSREVKGVVWLGEGLTVDGGFCGTVDVPATGQYVAGQTVLGNPNRLVVNPTFDVGGFELTVDFESTVSSDGGVLSAEARVDLPWLCGRDPVLTSTLYKNRRALSRYQYTAINFPEARHGQHF